MKMYQYFGKKCIFCPKIFNLNNSYLFKNESKICHITPSLLEICQKKDVNVNVKDLLCLNCWKNVEKERNQLNYLKKKQKGKEVTQFLQKQINNLPFLPQIILPTPNLPILHPFSQKSTLISSKVQSDLNIFPQPKIVDNKTFLKLLPNLSKEEPIYYGTKSIVTPIYNRSDTNIPYENLSKEYRIQKTSTLLNFWEKTTSKLIYEEISHNKKLQEELKKDTNILGSQIKEIGSQEAISNYRKKLENLYQQNCCFIEKICATSGRTFTDVTQRLSLEENKFSEM